jgi:hypothetical protein
MLDRMLIQPIQKLINEHPIVLAFIVIFLIAAVIEIIINFTEFKAGILRVFRMCLFGIFFCGGIGSLIYGFYLAGIKESIDGVWYCGIGVIAFYIGTRIGKKYFNWDIK